jgi:hypothetical protein
MVSRFQYGSRRATMYDSQRVHLVTGRIILRRQGLVPTLQLRNNDDLRYTVGRPVGCPVLQKTCSGSVDGIHLFSCPESQGRSDGLSSVQLSQKAGVDDKEIQEEAKIIHRSVKH